jgi:DNA polymerase I-like protein with 3'-5' exonuclease and polymerase domains
MTENAKRLLFVGTRQDEPYLQRLKPCIGTASCAVVLETPSTLYELDAVARAKNADAIITTSSALLSRLVNLTGGRRKPSIDNYAGSLFTSHDREIVILNPLEQLITVPYGQFLTSRYVSKLTARKSWPVAPQFNWTILEPSNAEELFEKFSHAYILAVDIETFKDPLSIRCVGYTAIFADGTTSSVVIPCDSLYNLTWIRRFNWDIKCPKVLQNGKYDIAYLSMYNAPLYNYLYDTAALFHCWYSELPKDLAAINAFCVREAVYWKDLADTSDLHTYYLYNAKDTWVTALALLAIIREAPQWALDNYANEFPLQFPCHLAEMTGIRRDVPSLSVQCKQVEAEIATREEKLSRQLGVPHFNVNSPVQMKLLLKVLGCGDLPSADAKNLAKAKLRHPLNAHLINQILKIRKLRKLVSTYLTPGKEYRGRILYALNPHGTDTGRLASKEHHFWCGLQIQNIPRGAVVKRTFVADDGFRIAECDLEQAESRDTAHIAGDENLITAVSGTRDFHSVNASAFFGVPYDGIYDDAKGKARDKPLRDLAKRVNHGANYNMGPGVLIDTMGEDKVAEAARILKLPRLWTYKQIAEYLLAQFHKTYPAISKIYYPGVIHEVQTTKRLTSKAIHSVAYQAVAAGWTRYCFADPSKSKSALNAYVAHPPQSLNAMTLNKAFMKVFYEIALVYPKDFKLLAQIHDSILFQFRIGKEFLAEKVKECMEIPVSVVCYNGKERKFTVPAALKAGVGGAGADNWGDTE